MNSPPPIRPRITPPDTTQHPLWFLLIAVVVTALCLFSALGKLGLVGPDDPRYAFIARAMLQTGDWVTPRLYGRPWFEKPVLYYWAAAASFRLFGVTESAARLPSALGALLAALAMAWAALRAYGRGAATLTLLLLPATVAAIAFARAATPDMLFAGLLAAAAAAGFAALIETPRAGRAAQIVFGIALGAATLAKGPAAVILAAGATFLWSLAARQWRSILRLLNPITLASFSAVALPWYILCAARNPEFFRVFILQHNFARYLTPVFRHPQPFWFFGVVILAATVPWTACFVPLAISAKRGFAAGNWRDSPALFFACWAAFPIVFFSFSQSKLPGYILPSVPPLILLFAVDAQRYLTATRGGEDHRPDSARYAKFWIAANAGLFLILALAARIWLGQLPAESQLGSPLALPGLLTLTLAGGVACFFLAIAGRPRLALLCESLLMTAILLGVNARVLPRLDPYLSTRAAVREMPSDAMRAPGLAVFELDRAWQYGLNFYLDRELPEWTPALAKTAQPVWIWTSAAGASELGTLGVNYSVVKRVTSQVWLVRAKP